MNRGLVLALLILAFVLTLVGADTLLLFDAIEENEVCLSSLSTAEIPSARQMQRIRSAWEEHRLLFSLSLSEGDLTEYEEALCALETAALQKDAEEYAFAHAQATLALGQIKKSALLSAEQIF